jgi:hypothetical protein
MDPTVFGPDRAALSAYMIIDQNNWIVAGEKFGLSLEQVEAEAGL